MSSRGALFAAVLAVAGVAAYLLFGRGEPDAPDDHDTQIEVHDQTRQARASGHSTAGPQGVAEPRRHTLRGRVESADGPVVGAVVNVGVADDDEDNRSPRMVRTTDDGSFEVTELAAGRYAVSATAPGYLPGVRPQVTVEADVSLTFTLDRGGHPLQGTVADATGGEIEGAQVRVSPLAGVAQLRRTDGFGTLSNEDGAFTLHVQPGRYRMAVSHEDYATEERTVEVGPGAQTQAFALVPMGVIEGVVVADEGGQPVADAKVTWQRERQVTLMPGRRMSIPADGGMVKADAQGHFRIGGLAPGAVSLFATGPGRASTEPTVIPLAMAEHVSDAEVIVAKAHDVRGRVVSANDPDAGIAGATVQLLRAERHSPSARTDADGYFVLSGMLSGPATLAANARGWAFEAAGTRIDVGDDTGEVTLTLKPAPTIVGRVDPPVQAEVSIELRPETMSMGMGQMVVMGGGGGATPTDEQGAFELASAGPGRATLVARVADGRSGEAVVEVGPDGARDVVITLEDRTTVRGVVRTESGSAVAQALVSLREKKPAGTPTMRLTVNGRDMGSPSGNTTADGAYEIGGVKPGEYEVRIVDRYGETMTITSGGALGKDGSASVAIADTDVATVDVVVDAHDGVIRGRVLTGSGEPVPDVWVQASLLPPGPGPMGGPSPDEEDGAEVQSEMQMIVSDGSGGGSRPPVLTDEDGQFEITGLRDAEYELVAESGGGRQRVSQTARPGTKVTLALAELATIEGQVTLDGQPLKSFGVRVEGPTSMQRHVRDSGGHFEIGRLDPGQYAVIVTAPDGSGRATVTVDAGQTATKNIVLEHGLTVKGRIVDEQGAPIEGAMIMIGAGSEGEISIQQDGSEEIPMTDSDGNFEVSCAAGPRVLLALSPGSPQPLVVHFFVAQPGQDEDLGELKQKPPGEMMVQEHDAEVVQ